MSLAGLSKYYAQSMSFYLKKQKTNFKQIWFQYCTDVYYEIFQILDML